MKKTRPSLLLLPLLTLLLGTATAATAGSISHYAGGLINIRDLIVPEEGFYGVLYNYYYQSGRLNDRNGNQVNSITINPGPGPGLTLNIQPDVDVYAIAPTLVWVTPYKPLGARFGMMIVTQFATASVGASLDTETGWGVNPDTSQFGIGDWYFQPLWLGWTLDHWDFSLGYGFYAPTGKYDTRIVSLPVVGNLRVADADNIGLGFWTNQFQGQVAWYPWTNKATAVTVALTYEINSEKEDFRLTPGHNLTMNWGISQYLPLTKDQQWLAEIGPAGYDSWQVTSDKGKDAANGVLDQVHGVGGQVGVTSVPWETALNFHYFHEVAAQDRFRGHVFGLNLSKKF